MNPDREILIMVENTQELNSIANVLSETSAKIIKATSVNEALAASHDHDFALAVLDVQMPGMKAYELAELLRNVEKTRTLPILFLCAAHPDDYRLFRGYEFEAVDFLVKPYHPKILLNKVMVFLQMAGQRTELMESIRTERSNRYFEAILMSMSDSVIIVSPKGVIQDVNKATLALLGYGKEDELLGVPVNRFFDPSGDTAHVLLDFRPQDSSRMQDFHNIEVLLRTSGGVGISALLSGSVFRDVEGKPLGTVLLVRDITERKCMEEQLNAYMLRLEQSNRQLQEFAAVASHDLQEPLRKIKAFGDLLISKHGKLLNDEAMDFLERMRNAAERMQILMESLLTYSRVTTKAEPFARVDLNKVFRNVLNDLEWRINQTEAEVKVTDLVTIEAEPNQMHQLFQNLLGNALKFHGDRKPVVKVSCRIRSKPKRTLENGTCRICVEDNGIGFDEKYLDRLFAPFQRLHGRNEYEGTGMGLAICNRIVERHGGSIEASSSPGNGAKFVVTLPLRQNKEDFSVRSTTGDQLSLYGEVSARKAGK
jgi:PAS domain S-box-containing protein